MDSLGRKVVKDLQTEHHGEDFGFDERLRVDDWGFLMSGQEHHFRDMLHPRVSSLSALPPMVLCTQNLAEPTSCSGCSRELLVG